MSVPVSGEHHERAVEAAEIARGWNESASTRAIINAYHRSLAEQGVVLVEQPQCPKCEGRGRTRHNDPDCQLRCCIPCSRCNGTGYIRLVDLREVVEWLRDPRTISPDEADGASGRAWAAALEGRFGGVSDGD